MVGPGLRQNTSRGGADSIPGSMTLLFLLLVFLLWLLLVLVLLMLLCLLLRGWRVQVVVA